MVNAAKIREGISALLSGPANKEYRLSACAAAEQSGDTPAGGRLKSADKCKIGGWHKALAQYTAFLYAAVPFRILGGLPGMGRFGNRVRALTRHRASRLVGIVMRSGLCAVLLWEECWLL